MPAEARGLGSNTQAGARFSRQQEEIGKKGNKKNGENNLCICVHMCACVCSCECIVYVAVCVCIVYAALCVCGVCLYTNTHTHKHTFLHFKIALMRETSIEI